MAPFQPDKNKLQMLPDELLLLTVEALAPAGSVLKYTKDYKASRASLRSLCLVSKRMDGFARPVLYRDVRLYSYARAVRLSSTLLTYPMLTSHVKSILFSPPQPYQERPQDQVSILDLRHLGFLQDPDIEYWTEAIVRMPQCTMEELVYNLVFKVLSRTTALEALYLKLHSEDGHYNSEGLRRLGGDAEYMQQVDLQRRLLVDFCEGSSRPNLPNLKTVGVLGGIESSWSSYYTFTELFQSLFKSPNLQEVHWAQLDHAMHGTTMLWISPFEADWYEDRPEPSTHHSELTPITLLICFGLNSNIRPTNQGYLTMSRSVTRIKLLGVDISFDDIVALTKAFPCLESLTVKDDCKKPADHKWCKWKGSGSLGFQYFGLLDNFHTLELDVPREGLAEDCSTESGPSKLVRLSAMSKLHTLMVPVDLFVGFDESARIQRITTLLPDSLRCLTLLLNDQCDWALMKERRTCASVKRVVGEFLRDEVAPALLIEFPHLEKIDLCYHWEHYHRNKVHTLAARSIPDATNGVKAS